MATINLHGTTETDQTRGPRRLEPSGERGGTQATRSSSSNAPNESDAVRFSERAETVRRLVNSARQLPEIRQDRVNELQSRIHSGSYDPASDDVADAILRAA